MSDERERDFLSRWSERKTEARRPRDRPGEPATPPEEPVDEAAALEALGLPDPDELGPGADFAAFMAAGVPPAIRSRALRRLWRSDPRLAALDGLVDHGEDFTDSKRVSPALRTAYRVGRGLLRERTTAGEAPHETRAAEPPRSDAETPAADTAERKPLPPAPEISPAAEPPAPAARPHRMRFAVPEAEADAGTGSRRSDWTNDKPGDTIVPKA